MHIHARFSVFGLSLIAFLPTAFAATEIRVKTDEATMFSTEALVPPPVTVLEKGVTLKVLHRSAASSLVRTEGGLQGWVSNENLVAVKMDPGGKMNLPDQAITGDGEV